MIKSILFTSLITISSNAICQNDLDELVDLMTGSFDSHEQAEYDSTYFNISLHMYPIWENADAKWLYVEQALFTKQQNPYRQRIYKVEMLKNGDFASYVYTIKNQEDFVGKWKSPDFFNQFDESILDLRDGCEVVLKREGDNKYSGATAINKCESNLRGAKYATSKVKIASGKIESWDQGFDENGNQVWGAEKGPYIFVRSNK